MSTVEEQLFEVAMSEQSPSITKWKTSLSHTHSSSLLLPNGYCIIIDNSTSSTNKQSKHRPIKRLCHILQDQYSLHTHVLSQLSCDAIRLLLKTVSQIDHTPLSCLLVVIIGIGDQGAINGIDERGILPKEIIDVFSDDKCPSLINKPKIFLFQMIPNPSAPDQTKESSDAIKITCTIPYSSQCPQYPQLSSLLDVLYNYADNITTGSVFLHTHQSDSITSNTQLGQAFVLPSPTKPPKILSVQFLLWELIMTLRILLPVRKMVINSLKTNKRLIIKTCNDLYAAKLIGRTGGVAGTVLSIGGLGLIPVTLGLSLVLTGVGAGIGTVGGVTALMSTAAETVSKSDLKDLQHIVVFESQLCQIVANLRQRLSSLAPTEKDLLETVLTEIGVKVDVSINQERESQPVIVTSIDLPDVVTNAYQHLNKKEFSASDWLQEFTDKIEQEFNLACKILDNLQTLT